MGASLHELEIPMNTLLITTLITTLAVGIPIYAWVWDDQAARPQKGENANPERELLWEKRPRQIHITHRALETDPQTNDNKNEK